MDQGQFDIRNVIRDAIDEFVKSERTKAEPAYKTELTEERKRREQLEQRVNELVDENNRSRARAEEVERGSQIRSELQRLGVAKLDLAFRAVKDEIQRAEDGRLIARTESGELPLREYLTQFVNENPELLPARMAGGSGAMAYAKNAAAPGRFIRSGQDPAGHERRGTREEFARRFRAWRRRRCAEFKQQGRGSQRLPGKTVSKSQIGEQDNDASYYIGQCCQCDREARGGGCTAGVDGEPCHG